MPPEHDRDHGLEPPRAAQGISFKTWASLFIAREQELCRPLAHPLL